MRSIFLTFLLAGSLLAQGPSPAPSISPAPIQTFAGGGASYNRQGSPKVTGWFVFAQRVGTSSTFSYSAVDLLYQAKRLPTTSFETGVAQYMRPIGSAALYGLAAAGASATGQSITGSFSGGGMLVYNVPSKNIALTFPFRIIKVNSNATQYSVGVGIGWIK